MDGEAKYVFNKDAIRVIESQRNILMDHHVFLEISDEGQDIKEVG
jgi:hypothetical protein